MGYQGWCSQQYGNNVGGWNNSYCGGDNNYGYGSTFVLIVVLFILLIIVGATYI
ncbi:YjcZ family sporulation protein [Lysinibacillus sp. FSL H8-0500]|uniref:YjcZ family sporulation protein n=1 Tax=Lysinibacillus TaxID=400634 RepID=UPI0009F8DBBE|nr:YjcZ family sporulation protein [Lysinibacillus macroides]QPR66524.1 YjcZ family sporulation protein [Lysinibacillus macroides]